VGLTARLLRIAAARPRVLVVPVPGAAPVRLALEAALARRDWPAASSPANTDLLVVAGAAGPELASVVDTLWGQLPAPKARAEVTDSARAEAALDEAATQLVDLCRQRRIARAVGSRADQEPTDVPREHQNPSGHRNELSLEDHKHTENHHEHHSRSGNQDEHGRVHDPKTEHRSDADYDAHQHEGHYHDVHQHEAHERRQDHGEDYGDGGHRRDPRLDDGGHEEKRGEHQHGGHEGSGHEGSGHQHHHGADIEMPGGLPMAELGEDRDGLMLDRLHVALGPVLPDWPAGLVLRLALQGDVIQQAQARVLDQPGGKTFWTELAPAPTVVADVARRVAVCELDALARLLSVAGWDVPAATARRLRDQLLAGAPATQVRPPTEALLRRVRRSRTLRWLLRGVGSDEASVAARLAARLTALGAALAELDNHRAVTAIDPNRLRHLRGADRIDVNRLAALLVGAELAAARLIVAALDLDIEFVVSTAASGQAHHG
jgi:hypothetical protein